jgi:D-alanine-D-alanine ligase
MARIVVGILRGGPSDEYAHSLKTGTAMLNALPEDRYDARDIFVDKKGYWHWRGMPSDPGRILSQVDVVLNAMHGGPGENGMVQRILDRAGIPYAGARAHAAALSLHKARARQALAEAGVMIPQGVAFSIDDGLTTGEMAREVFSRFGPQYVVKPAQGGGSVGIRLVPTIVELPDAIGDVLDAYGSAVVEEYVSGHEASVGVIEHFRDEELYALPPVHVIPTESMSHVSAQARELGLVKHIVPVSYFSDSEKRSLIDAARAAHRALGMSHFSNADIILTRRGPVVLEVDAHPVLHEYGAFPKALDSVGSNLREFLEHSIKLAQQGK